MARYILRAVSKKTAEIVELEKQCFPSDAAEKSRGPGTSFWWVLRYDGEAVGYCSMRLLPNEPGVAMSMRSCVVEGHRGHGLQRRMIDARCKKAKELGCNLILATTMTDNPSSANNFHRCGWEIYDPQYRWMAADTIYWRKKL